MERSNTTAIMDVAEMEEDWNEDPSLAFELGVELAIERWDVLDMAIENGWGTKNVNQSREVREELIDSIIDWFLKSESSRPEWDEVSDYLLNALRDEFNTECEDHSDEHIARLIVQIYIDAMQNQNFEGIKKMFNHRNQVRANQAAARSVVFRQLQEQESDDGDSDGIVHDDEEKENIPTLVDLNLSGPQSQPSNDSQNEPQTNRANSEPPANEEEDDGWTTVTSNRTRNTRRH